MDGCLLVQQVLHVRLEPELWVRAIATTSKLLGIVKFFHDVSYQPKSCFSDEPDFGVQTFSSHFSCAHVREGRGCPTQGRGAACRGG